MALPGRGLPFLGIVGTLYVIHHDNSKFHFRYIVTISILISVVLINMPIPTDFRNSRGQHADTQSVWGSASNLDSRAIVSLFGPSQNSERQNRASRTLSLAQKPDRRSDFGVCSAGVSCSYRAHTKIRAISFQPTGPF